MHDIWEPALQARINQFIARKAKQYPELRLADEYGTTSQYGYFVRMVAAHPRTAATILKTIRSTA